MTFSLPAAGSILIVTFFGLGVLARLPLSEEMRTAGTGTCASSPSDVRPAGMVATVRVPLVTMEGRPPCVGQAEPRAVVAVARGLLTPGISGGETDVAGVKFVLAPAGEM